MKAFVTKENKTGGNDSGTATSWGANEQNSLNDEMVNVVETTGQTPTIGTGADTDTTQVAQAVTIYAQTGHAYQDSGVSDAYVLTAIAGIEQPISYYDGAKISFATSNINTGASTINISALGVKKILDFSGNELVGGAITVLAYNVLVYDAAADSGSGAFITALRTAAFADIVGTVSESAGVPTGAIIEHGSNANGEYIRWADGTQICVSPLLSSGAVNIADGNIFSNSSTSWNYPAAFILIPAVTGAPSGGISNIWMGLGISGNTINTATAFAHHPVGSASVPTFHLTAIGRWF